MSRLGCYLSPTLYLPSLQPLIFHLSGLYLPSPHLPTPHLAHLRSNPCISVFILLTLNGLSIRNSQSLRIQLRYFLSPDHELLPL
jgi:hypothetical protein